VIAFLERDGWIPHKRSERAAYIEVLNRPDVRFFVIKNHITSWEKHGWKPKTLEEKILSALVHFNVEQSVAFSDEALPVLSGWIESQDVERRINAACLLVAISSEAAYQCIVNAVRCGKLIQEFDYNAHILIDKIVKAQRYAANQALLAIIREKNKTEIYYYVLNKILEQPKPDMEVVAICKEYCLKQPLKELPWTAAFALWQMGEVHGQIAVEYHLSKPTITFISQEDIRRLKNQGVKSAFDFEVNKILVEI
jgi:hypothetical protein